MRNILIITSHFPPSNLVGVHRARLFAKNLPKFGWNPIVLTVNEMHYEEKLDYDLCAFIPKNQQVEYVNAFNLTKLRIIGDLGLRSFFQLLRRANHLIKENKVDFIYIILPSFYLSLLGPLLYYRHRIRYGLDYMDPWVHIFPGSEKKLSRHWWSTILSKILEPIAVRNVSLITGVSEQYYKPLFERNPSLNGKVVSVAIPYGWDKDDFRFDRAINNEEPIFRKNDKIKLIYPGAFLPQSKRFLESFFNVIASNRELFREVEFYFIGTGKTVGAKISSPIKEHAEQYGIYGEVVFEYPHRLTYLNTLDSISKASGIFIMGSTELHYTPSKLFNAFITRRPIFAILHEQSSGIKIIESSGWGIVTPYNDQLTAKQLEENILDDFRHWLSINKNNQWNFDDKVANEYAIHQITSKLNDSILSAL
jgi:hypothetical protein